MALNLKIEYNLEKDVQNWKESLNKESYSVSWNKFLPDDISLECVNNNECLSKYLKENYSLDKINKFIDLLNKLINPQEIQNDLENLLNAKFTTNDFKIFITTFHRAPYNIEKNYFYLIYRESNTKRAVSGIYHELMHFLFHQNYWDYCKNSGLNDTKIHILKESLTVLLNEILEKRGLPLDKGYSAHQKIREKIKNCKKDSNDFKKLLTNIINEVPAAF